MLKGFSTVTLWLASASMALAQGASLQDTVGTVLVNSGSGFLPAADGAILDSRDIVSVKPHGAAFLVYADGCRTKLTPGRTVTVGATLCAEKRELADLPERQTEPEMPPVTPVGFGGGSLLGGVVVAGAGIGAAIALANRNEFVGPSPHPRRPVSP